MVHHNPDLERWLEDIEARSLDELMNLESSVTSEAELRARRRLSAAVRQHGLDVDVWFLRDRLVTAIQFAELRSSGPARALSAGERQRLEWSAIALFARDVVSEEDYDLLAVTLRRPISPRERLPAPTG